ncbi:MAG TPA: hypothetical protein P5061_15090, partial [Mycobacterium sp.]|nr:hypothetical protein [Mycobacterium sp.]
HHCSGVSHQLIDDGVAAALTADQYHRGPHLPPSSRTVGREARWKRAPAEPLMTIIFISSGLRVQSEADLVENDFH